MKSGKTHFDDIIVPLPYIYSILLIAVLFFIFHAPIGNFLWKKFHFDIPAAVLNNNDPEFFVEMGNYFFRTANYDIDKAERYFSRAVYLNDKVPFAHYQLARIYFIKGNFPWAIDEINKEMKIQPEFRQSYYVRGLIEGYAGIFDRSAADFEKFISFYPFDWAGYNDLAWVYFRKGDYEKSKDAALRGIKAAPRNADNPWLLNSAGIALLNLDKKEEAADYFKEAIKKLNTMAPEDWGKAYPGNDPAIYSEGLDKMKESILYNLKLSGNS